MATEIFYSPLAEVRWAHLVEPRQQMDPEKPLAWSVDLLLPLGEATSQAFLEKLERQFVEAHGSKKRRSDKGEPWKLDKEQPNQLMVVKFKAQQLTRRDGSQASGPRLIDASKQPWNGAAIGNGSRLVIAYVIHGWDRPEGWASRSFPVLPRWCTTCHIRRAIPPRDSPSRRATARQKRPWALAPTTSSPATRRCRSDGQAPS